MLVQFKGSLQKLSYMKSFQPGSFMNITRSNILASFVDSSFEMMRAIR